MVELARSFEFKAGGTNALANSLDSDASYLRAHLAWPTNACWKFRLLTSQPFGTSGNDTVRLKARE